MDSDAKWCTWEKGYAPFTSRLATFAISCSVKFLRGVVEEAVCHSVHNGSNHRGNTIVCAESRFKRDMYSFR